MKFYVTKEGKNLGPFDLEEVNKKLSHKEFLPEDMAWMEGMEKWTPINDKRFISKGILSKAFSICFSISTSDIFCFKFFSPRFMIYSII